MTDMFSDPTAHLRHSAVAHVDSDPYYDGGLTPDAILVYLSTRLGGLEDQINDIFSRQQQTDKLRSLLNDMKHAIGTLETHAEDTDGEIAGGQDVVDRLLADIDAIRALDPGLAAKIESDLDSAGYVLCDQDDDYLASQIEPSLEYLDNAISDLNSSSQINMIRLQSLVRAHETAVSLGTNLVDSAGRTTQKIADRIGG